MDFLFIKKLIVFTTIGVYEWEQHIQQKLVIDIELAIDYKNIKIKDNIKYCINYVEVTQAIIEYVQGKCFCLIETVAEEIAALLIQRFKTATVRVKIAKPGAIPEATMVGISIQRGLFIK